MTSKLARRVHWAAGSAGCVGLLVIAGAAFFAQKQFVAQDLRDRAKLAMNSFDASLHYTDQQVAPLLQRQLGAQFLPQAVPFYAASRASGLDTHGANATIRLPTTNPTNEVDKPSVWEAGIIKAFADKPDLGEIESVRQEKAGRSFALARPIVAEPACLTCHGNPTDAPQSLVQVYGSAGGFGWKRGNIVGAAIVSIPEAEAQSKALAVVSIFAAVVAAVLVGVVALLDYFVQVMIVRPLERLAQYAGDASLGVVDGFRPSTIGSEAIASLAKAFDRMRNSLAIATQMLEQPCPREDLEPAPSGSVSRNGRALAE